jgi:PIN domain nuclease of toxin-antitoxin system
MRFSLPNLKGIDTSALFKRYQSEKGTATVTRILEDHSQPLYISSITIVDMVSNLKRLFEADKITTEEQFQLQRDFFYKDIVTLAAGFFCRNGLSDAQRDIPEGQARLPSEIQ